MNSWDVASMQLLAELKMIFPEIPEQQICDCIVENSKDKDACIKFLTRVNEDYLFGCQSPITALSISDNFNNSNELTEHNDSKETLDSELDIYIPEGTMNYKFLLNEEKKSLNLKDGNRTVLPETDEKDESQNHAAYGKGTIRSAPVISSASCPFGLMDNGNVFSASSQTELPSNTDIAHLLTQNSYLNKDILKWNNNCNELTTQFPQQTFSRGFSYPIPAPFTGHLQHIPFSPLPPPAFYHSNQLPAKDYTTPLYISVTSPQFLTPSYITSHPSIGLLPSSSNSQRQLSPISSHLTTSYSSPLSAVLPPTSLSSSVAHIPTFPYPSAICPPQQKQPPMSNMSHSPTYGYEHPVTEDQLRGKVSIKPTNSFQQAYELFPIRDGTSTTNLLPSFLPNTKQPEENKEMDYVKALLQHQCSNYNLLLKELFKMRTFLYTLRQDVSSREQELSQIRQHQKFPNMEQIQKLKEEIIKLRVERDCLTMELDLHIQGQESSTSIEENFYENIFTGPKGPIPPAPNNTIAQNSYAGRRDEDDRRNKWNCSKCTYENHPDLIDCEICESPRVMIN